MARPTGIEIDTAALKHNLAQVKQQARQCKVIAMVKANAYGCGLSEVASVLASEVDAFGVACIEEALLIRSLNIQTPCVLFEGIFAKSEIELLVKHKFEIVLHSKHQLDWILASPQTVPLKIWVKINTGMNRLGFAAADLTAVFSALRSCPWVDEDLGLITHLASADEESPVNFEQLQAYQSLPLAKLKIKKSIANSAAILSLIDSHADVVRPGIMLYGVSPFSNKTAKELNLIPVMRFYSSIIAIYNYPANSAVGYGGSWQTSRPSRIAVVAAGYGDGYPRVVKAGTLAWVEGQFVPLVGRVSMDMLTLDITDFPSIQLNASVELWGKNMPVELIAESAGTIGYELLCQVQRRPTMANMYP